MFSYASTALTALFDQISVQPIIYRQHHRRWREASACVFMTNKSTDGWAPKILLSHSHTENNELYF